MWGKGRGADHGEAVRATPRRTATPKGYFIPPGFFAGSCAASLGSRPRSAEPLTHRCIGTASPASDAGAGVGSAGAEGAGAFDGATRAAGRACAPALSR